MKKFYFLLPVIVLCYFLMTGQKAPETPEKWDQPLPTWIYDLAVVNSAPLPQSTDYFNPNTQTRFVRTPYEVLSVTPNIRPLPRTNSYQSEVIICRHPLNPLIMFGSSNAFNNVGGSLFISEGVYVTTNGGANWFGSDTLNGAPISNHGGDPAPTIDKDGNFIITHLGRTIQGIFGNFSTNNGLTWSPNYTIISGSQDKNLSG
ncbi:MAG: hypothetical protein M3P82_06400, partial [Bacteroidota bacterium]|nr:hypothetical protein [Bacteroidota bacterium]